MPSTPRSSSSSKSRPDDTSSNPLDQLAGSAADSTMSENGGKQHHHHGGSMATLALAALGVVYGDIGTSPLYALRESVAHLSHGSDVVHMATWRADVLGLLSLFFWSLMLVVTMKYVVFITRADNEGEGGILALLSLVLPRNLPRGTTSLVIFGLFGAALLYADGMLTPAISVLSAVEGIRGIQGLEQLDSNVVVGVAIAILFVLFRAQHVGTAKVGVFFGPIMLVWFVVIGAVGIYWIKQDTSVLWATVDPRHAVMFFVRHGYAGFLVLGSVVLCITGGEALYADMGHFGRQPIMRSWLYFVAPALTLNYMGQGAFLLKHPELKADSFFSMFGGDMSIRLPVVLLATAATVIASQALISGAFSLTRQAIQLGYMPRLEIRHTSGEHEGQIYVPEINTLLMVACVALVLTFRSSSAMASAYGIAVTGTMAITTLLFFVVTRKWWGPVRAGILCGVMLVIDLAFFSANATKFLSGGWVPILVALIILYLMLTWNQGRERVSRFMKNRSEPLDDFLEALPSKNLARVKGTAVFMTSAHSGTPPVLLHHLKHNQVLHEQVVLLSIITEDVPTIPRQRRVTVEQLQHGFFRVIAHYGFMQSPKVIDVLRSCEKHGLHTDKRTASFYLGREKLVVTKNAGMSRLRKWSFAFLSRNARPATDFFAIPSDRAIEMGMHLEL